MNPDAVITHNTSSPIGVLEASVYKFTAAVYGFMALGLAITAITALGFYLTIDIVSLARMAETLLPFVVIGQLILVLAFSFLHTRVSAVVAAAMFIAYAISVGFTFSFLFAVYTFSSIFMLFFITAGIFAVMAVLGFVTKSDLSRWGMVAFMGVLGLIIASVVNIFLQSSGLNAILNYLGVFIFTFLIAYDSQKVKKYAEVAAYSGKFWQLAIGISLSLYLDFINLFIRLLQIFGKRR